MQSWSAKIKRDASPKYTESKGAAVKNSVTRRNSRKIESKKGRVTRDGIYERSLTQSVQNLAKKSWISSEVRTLREFRKWT